MFTNTSHVRVIILIGCLILLTACASEPKQSSACGTEDRTLNVGFYAFFEPVSYSESEDPASPEFNAHRGYEADLLTALEAMEGPKLTLARQGLAHWDGIWLQSGGDRYDLVGGGITILDSRTRDASGNEAVAFTSGHIHFRQSLLVRAADAGNISSHDDLTSDMKVGALAATTGEHRLLELLGLVNEEGALASGTTVETSGGRVVADGSADYFITAAESSANLADRTRLHLPGANRPEIVYLGSELGEAELLSALADGSIDAIARGEVGNRDAVHASGGVFAVTSLDGRVENGGFTVAADDGELLACLNRRINWLTDDQEIGYGEWLENPQVFEQRAAAWNGKAIAF